MKPLSMDTWGKLWHQCGEHAFGRRSDASDSEAMVAEDHPCVDFLTRVVSNAR